MPQLAAQISLVPTFEVPGMEAENANKEETELSALDQKRQCKYRKSCYETGTVPDITQSKFTPSTLFQQQDMDTAQSQPVVRIIPIQQRCKYRKSCYETGILPEELQTVKKESAKERIMAKALPTSVDALKRYCRYRKSCYLEMAEQMQNQAEEAAEAEESQQQTIDSPAAKEIPEEEIQQVNNADITAEDDTAVVPPEPNADDTESSETTADDATAQSQDGIEVKLPDTRTEVIQEPEEKEMVVEEEIVVQYATKPAPNPETELESEPEPQEKGSDFISTNEGYPETNVQEEVVETVVEEPVIEEPVNKESAPNEAEIPNEKKDVETEQNATHEETEETQTEELNVPAETVETPETQTEEESEEKPSRRTGKGSSCIGSTSNTERSQCT